MSLALDLIGVLFLAWAAFSVAAFLMPTVCAATTEGPLTGLCPTEE